MPQPKPIKVYISKMASTREVERPDGTFYKIETWTLFDNDGKRTQVGRTETEIPYYSRSVEVTNDTKDLIKKLQYSKK